MSFKSLAGFYTLLHRPTGYFYIGSTGNISRRISAHKWDFSQGLNSNKKLQEIFTCWEDFDLTVTYVDTVKEAREWEKKLLDVYLRFDKCCNIAIDPLNPLAGLSIAYNAEAWELTRKKGNLPDVRERVAVLNRKKVTLDGVEYDSLGSAAVALGIHISTVRWGLKTATGKYKDWKYSGLA